MKLFTMERLRESDYLANFSATFEMLHGFAVLSSQLKEKKISLDGHPSLKSFFKDVAQDVQSIEEIRNPEKRHITKQNGLFINYR